MNTRSKSFHGWIYFVLKKQCNSILLHRSVFNMLFSQRLPSQCCFSKMPVNPSTCPPHCPPLAQKKKIREKTSKEAQIFTLADLNEVLPPPPPPLRLSSWTNRMAGSFLKARFGLCSRAWPCKAAFFGLHRPFACTQE